jgi:hypothetical protein
MSMAEKFRHSNSNRREESRVRSQSRKFEMKKRAAVINHIEFERHHGYESANPQLHKETVKTDLDKGIENA